jgi:tRNA threonylcarbamoyladenosine biosynthesis protein TsaE
MNTDLSFPINSFSSESTEQIAEQIGRRLRGGELIVLESDLGGGKTTFTRGLARGAGSKDVISSPTFTISNIYETPKNKIHHFDFYRLNDPGLITYELSEATDDRNSIVIIEWANIIANVLPANIIKVKIHHQEGDNRHIDISYPKSHEYLIVDLT